MHFNPRPFQTSLILLHRKQSLVLFIPGPDAPVHSVASFARIPPTGCHSFPPEPHELILHSTFGRFYDFPHGDVVMQEQTVMDKCADGMSVVACTHFVGGKLLPGRSLAVFVCVYAREW